MAIQIIISQVGPLPINLTFQAPSDAPLVLVVSGSVWSAAANAAIGINVALDSQSIGAAHIFSNGPNTHRAVVPAYIAAQLKQGPHTLSLTALTGATLSDVNDFYTAVLEY
jgi:hypothetical protein